MKASELMINDWVHFLNMNGRVAELKDQFCEFKPLSHATYDLVDPIPLTAEILEKNEIDQENCYLTNINDEYFQLHIEIDGVELFKRIIYVHELQQALRLCGLNELADNLKL